MRAMIVTGPFPDDWTAADITADLDNLQELVGGGYIEALPIDSSKATVYINEEGKLKRMPITALWLSEEGELNDTLMGPLVLLGPVDEEGNTQPLTDEALAYIRTVIKPAAMEPLFKVTSR